uniref:Protein kinase domain-containing protein n=1 Tax=viral metagenome TaxID=1070528 RepID=A0A6C0JNW2_9ZZZZ
MPSISKVVGEGSFGCVHEPSLECDNPDINYNNKVSKLLLDKHAKTELDEYLGIQRADPENQFFLGVPLHCKPKNTTTNYLSARKCDIGMEATNISTKKFLPDYDLLIMENGGMNLHDFAIYMCDKPATPENRKIMENFWIECHRLFLGLSVFLKENIIHHDLKAQNIVYNPTTNRVAFIDFGLMRPLDKVKKLVLSTGDVRIAKNLRHWSFPVETVLYNKAFYNSNRVRKKLVDILKNGLKNVYDLDFLNNVLPDRNDGNDLIKRDTVANILFSSMVNLITESESLPYAEFVDRSTGTFDLYGMCMGLMYVFNKTYYHLKVTNSKIDYNELFFHLIFCFRPDNSRYTVEQALKLYEERVLADILREDHIIFINHIPTKIDPPHLRVPKMSDAALEKSMEEKDEKLRKKICPAGKVLNPLTGRCVKECKVGQQRDDKFLCRTVKAAREKLKKKKILKEEKDCPEYKERNPRTRRCIKKCNPGYERNHEFRCVKE